MERYVGQAVYVYPGAVCVCHLCGTSRALSTMTVHFRQGHKDCCALLPVWEQAVKVSPVVGARLTRKGVATGEKKRRAVGATDKRGGAVARKGGGAVARDRPVAKRAKVEGYPSPRTFQRNIKSMIAEQVKSAMEGVMTQMMRKARPLPSGRKVPPESHALCAVVDTPPQATRVAALPASIDTVPPPSEVYGYSRLERKRPPARGLFRAQDY